MVVSTVQPGCQRMAEAGREPLPEAPGRSFHARQPPHVRVPLERAPDSPQRPQEILREVPSLGEYSVENRCGVSFRQNEAVTIRPRRLYRIVAENAPEIEGDHDLDR